MKHPKVTASFLLTCLLLTVSAAAGSAAKPAFRVVENSLTPDSTFSGTKSVSGALAETDPALLGRSDSTPVNVMIKYDYDATASYDGGVAGLAATSPAVTGKPLKDNRGAVTAYEAHADQVTSQISTAVDNAVPSARIGSAFTTVYGGVQAQVPANRIGDLLKVPGVAAVQADSLNQPQSDETDFIGATNVFPSLGGPDLAADNVTVGVIDTGIWPEHPSFADHGLPAPPGGPYACQFGDGSDVAHLGQPFACNRKLVGAYAFTHTYMTLLGSDGQEFCNDTTGICSPRDPEGHGTHTASTAAGDSVASAILYGVDRGPVSGIAPGARIIAYRVCLSGGCFSSDSVAAVQQAIKDGVNVINFSISGGANPYTDPVEMAFLDAFHAGISVNAAAGNSGPGAGTSDHGGPWVTTVAASTGDKAYTSTLHLTADGGASLDLPGFTITGGITTPTPVVLAQNIPGEDVLCQTKLTGAVAAGKIVACQRGTNARIDKGFNVFSGGAAGMILYNPVKMDTETDNHWLPAIHVDGPSGPLLDFIGGHANVKAAWAPGTKADATGDVMASFSSRGPVGDFLKPDLTATGIQVLAGMTPQPDETTPTNGPGGNLYQAIAGTSMSTPHAAGASALVIAAHPDWTPAEVKSALMTSAAQDVVKEDGETPATPFDDGAGSIRVDHAIKPTLVFDENYADYAASATNPLNRIDLNLPSVDAPVMTGTITTRRTATNVTGREQNLQVSVDAPDGATITVSDKAPNPRTGAQPDDRIRLKRNGTTDIWITISAPDLADGQYFGRISLDANNDDGSNVTIPVAFFKKQGQVTLTHVCDPTTFPQKTGRAHCTASVANLASEDADVNLTVTNLDKGKGLDFTNITAPATAIRKNDGVQWSGTLTPALPPTVTSITPGGSPAGYLPLAGLGVAPISGVGDDTISNFGVPTFYYGGEPYTRLGVVSNGYLVLGGGDSGDIVFTPQTFPDPARPNNVIAPFWTDLNPSATGAGAIRIETLTDGSDDWIVVDWAAVKNFGNSGAHSFEIWLRVAGGASGADASSEQVTMAYGDNSAGGDPDAGSNWGAENRDGTSGQNLPAQPASGSDYTINLSPPTAGGTATIGYDASSKKAGTYRSVANMTSNVTPGTTQVTQTLTVTKP